MDFLKKSVISRDEENPYLVRWTLFGCNLFSIKLHHIMQSDDECLHDHPWSFISIILKGGYNEEAPLMEEELAKSDHLREKFLFKGMAMGKIKVWYGVGAILRRPAHYRHRLILPEGKTCWTLVLTGKPFREWGFWTKSGWVKHDEYDINKQNC